MDWIVPVYEVAMLVVAGYFFITLLRRVKHQGLTKTRALWYYLGWVMSPVVLYALFFLGLVGMEEVARRPLISEGLARSFLMLIGLGLLIWLLSSISFGIALLCIRASAASPNPGVERTP